jgi:TolB-like protein
MVAVFGFNSPTRELSDYVMEGIIDHLVRENRMKVVDRQNPGLIRQEIEMQYSGNISDEYIQSIGKQFGGEVIITGLLRDQGESYLMRLQAINVETAQILGTKTENIRMDSKLASLLKLQWSDPDLWKNQWLYLGARIGGAIGFYNFDNSRLSFGDIAHADSSLSLNFALQIALQILPIFAVQTEILYLQDTVDTTYEYGSYNYTYKSTSLMIPLLGKMTYRPKNFPVEGFGGIYLSIPIGSMEYKEPHFIDYEHQKFSITVGLMVGGNFGIKFGPGIIFADIRYLQDLSGTKTLIFEEVDSELYKRSKALFTLGYNIGLIDKR